MDSHAVVSRAEWLDARKELLDDEKEFTRLRDQLSERRRDLPWVRVDKAYMFEGPAGRETLADLFDGRSQLVVYHFMFGPDWEAGCKSCSFWADGFDGMVTHLRQRDVAFAAISRARQPKLQAFARRMGWGFKWVSSHGSDFNFDFGVSFTAEEVASGQIAYNYRPSKAYGPEMPGISVFARDRDGGLYHTYSCYARGIDMLNTTYNFLDLVPRGRDEAALPGSMAWVRLHDEYAG